MGKKPGRFMAASDDQLSTSPPPSSFASLKMTVREKKVCTYRGGKSRGRRPGRGGVIFDWRPDKRETECWNVTDKATHVGGGGGVTKKGQKFPEMMKNCPTLEERKKGLLIFVIYLRLRLKGRIAPPPRKKISFARHLRSCVFGWHFRSPSEFRKPFP